MMIRKRLKSIRLLIGENRTTLLLLALLIGVGLVFFGVFYYLNSLYIEELSNGNYQQVESITKNLFYTHFYIILYIAIFIVCVVIFTAKRFQEKTDYCLVLILWYLVLYLFARVNDINTCHTAFQNFISMVSDSLYELSTVPLILYVILKMKEYNKHMQLILLLECLSSLIYVIGYVVSDNSVFSIFKNVGCSMVFIITLAVLHIFLSIECRHGNRELKEFLLAEELVLVIYVFACSIAAIVKNDFYGILSESIRSLVYAFDLLPLRKAFLQDILILSIFVDYCIISFKEYADSVGRRKAIESELKLSESYNAISQSRVREVRKLKHDMKEHINVANMYCKSGEYDKLREYLESLGASTAALPDLVYSNNSTCNIILMYYSDKAKTEGIEFSGTAPVGENIGLSDSETTSLVSNILKNAYEACIVYRDNGCDKPFIRFNMYIINGKLHINCENSSLYRRERDESGRFKTTKRNTSEHGLGIDIAESICERHSGAAVFELKGSVFSVNAIIPVNLGKPEKTEK